MLSESVGTKIKYLASTCHGFYEPSDILEHETISSFILPHNEHKQSNALAENVELKDSILYCIFKMAVKISLGLEKGSSVLLIRKFLMLYQKT